MAPGSSLVKCPVDCCIIPDHGVPCCDPEIQQGFEYFGFLRNTRTDALDYDDILWILCLRYGRYFQVLYVEKGKGGGGSIGGRQWRRAEARAQTAIVR